VAYLRQHPLRRGRVEFELSHHWVDLRRPPKGGGAPRARRAARGAPLPAPAGPRGVRRAAVAPVTTPSTAA
jgi:hypothetical protein